MNTVWIVYRSKWKRRYYDEPWIWSGLCSNCSTFHTINYCRSFLDLLRPIRTKWIGGYLYVRWSRLRWRICVSRGPIHFINHHRSFLGLLIRVQTKSDEKCSHRFYFLVNTYPFVSRSIWFMYIKFPNMKISGESLLKY